MNFAVFDVMDKGLYLRQALEAAGHQPGVFPDVDLLILDCDWTWANPRPQLIDQAVEAGVKVALYPHGGQPTSFVYDGLTEPHPGVDLRLEHGPRNLDHAARLGLDINQQAHGWLYSPTAPFKPVKEPKRILFAPLHPNIEAMQNGHTTKDPAPLLNRHVYRQLLNLGYQITVSVVGPLWRNGIWFHPRATMTANPEMRFTRSYELVQQADVVVAAGTLAAAAVAAGKPTVFLDEPDCADYINGYYQASTHAADLIPDLRYPLVAADGDLDDLIRVACDGTRAAEMWRDWWVGDDGTDQAVRSLERLAPSSASVTIAGATARAGAQA